MAAGKGVSVGVLVGVVLAVLLVGFLFCGGLLVAIAVPGFLRAREVSRMNSCQENQVKIDGALQQYMLENNLETLPEAVPFLGSLAQATPGDPAFASVLVGEQAYIRFAPECPAGGLYSIDATSDWDVSPVHCSLSVRSDVDQRFWHTYPSYEQ